MAMLRVEGLAKTFHRPHGESVRAVNGVSFELNSGETLGLIGESGSGKSTVGRLVLGLVGADDGVIEFEGNDVRRLRGRELRSMRATAQIVFQEPAESLNPRMRIGDIIAEPLQIHQRGLSRDERRGRVRAALEEVGLGAAFAERFPRALSGGQQQRVGIARAIVTRPRMIVLDEPTSSLDLSVRAQILELLMELQRRHELAYLFISHDLATVEYTSHRVAVMYLGQIREIGPVSKVVGSPADPYTRALLSAQLSVDPSDRDEHSPLSGEIPSPTNLPRGCHLYGRCPIRIDACAEQPIPLREIGAEHMVRCIRADVPFSVKQKSD